MNKFWTRTIGLALLALLSGNAQAIRIDPEFAPALHSLNRCVAGNCAVTRPVYISHGGRIFVAKPKKIHELPVEEVSVPEPGTLALLGFGLAALGVTRRRRPKN